MSVAVSLSIAPELQQVEREVAGAGADLEAVAEARAARPPSALASFWPHLLLAGGAEVDAPLGVVLVGGGVVVAGVDVLDVLRRGGGGGWHGAELYAERRNARSAGGSIASRSMAASTSSANQPAGVPPLPLTGERTLPDVPEENYWYRRHLVVYEWIAARVGGKRVVDMACGEGYGSERAGRDAAASVVGVDANPEAHEHARLRYVRPNLRFERDLVESFAEPCDAVVFLQTIEHVAGRRARSSSTSSRCWRPAASPTSRPPTC